jgi:hypothetical protein
MQKLSILVIIATAAIIMFGCKKDKDEAPWLRLDTSQTELQFKADGTVDDNVEFTVSTNQGEWDAVSSQLWVTVSKNADGFTLSVVPNAEITAPEAATVTVTAGTATPIVLNVRQAAALPLLSLNSSAQTEVVFKTDGTTDGTTEFTVTTNAGVWEVSSSQSWVTVDKNAAGTGFTLSAASNVNLIVPNTNFAAPARTATITLSAGAATPIEITVTQESLSMIIVKGGITTINGASVNISSFQIGKYEVTESLWEAVMGSNPSAFVLGDNHPVDRVSWETAQTFISTLNTLTGKTYRLPTEVEWEYAAKGGQSTQNYTYSGGNTLSALGWYTVNSGRAKHEVGTKAPNELGIYDMSGNVWEWCSDWYGTPYPSDTDNPAGVESGTFRILRGGAWFHEAAYCNVSFRGMNLPAFVNDNNGLRLVLPL